MLAALALLALHAQTVSFTCRAETLPELAKDLGKAIGRDLTVARACENDMVLISAQNVSADRLLEEIARVDSAQWTKRGDQLELVPDLGLRARQKADTEQKRAVMLHKLIARKRAALIAKMAKLPNGAEQYQLPPARLAYEAKLNLGLLDLLDGIDLAHLPWDQRVGLAFATNPNRMQLALGEDAGQALSTIVAAYNACVIDPTSRDPADSDSLAVAPQVISGFAKADVLVAYSGLNALPDIELFLYDRTGKTLLTETYKDTFDTAEDSPVPKTIAIRDPTPVPLDDATRALMEAQRTLAARRYVDSGTPTPLRQYLEGSPRHDPLRLAPSDQLLAFGTAKAKPLVALVPDDATPFLSLDNSWTDLGVFESKLNAEFAPMAETERDGWIEITPTYPAIDRLFRLDRTAYRALLAASSARGVPNLDDIAAFAAKVPVMGSASLSTYLRAFVPEVRTLANNRATWFGLRLWASLDTLQRQALLDGSGIAVSSLSSDMVDALSDLVYGHQAFATVPQNAVDADDDYQSEPTESLPDGIPQNSTITATRSVAPILEVPQFAGGGPTPHVALGATDIANLLAGHEQNAGEVDPNVLPGFRGMRLGTRTTLTITIHLGGKLNYVARISDARFKDDASKVSMASLPADLNEAIQQALTKARARNNAIRQATGSNGDGAPPPSPKILIEP